METSLHPFDDSNIQSRLSFRPLVEALKKNLAEGNPGMQKLYGRVVSEIESHPELLQPITDLSILKPYSELIQELLASVFPPTTPNTFYAVAVPFKFQTVYTSRPFKTFFLKPNSIEINVPNEHVAESLAEARLEFAYG